VRPSQLKRTASRPPRAEADASRTTSLHVGDMLLLDFKPAQYPSVNYVSLTTSICSRSVLHRHTIQRRKLLDHYQDHFWWGPMRAIYEDRIWQTQFPSCCTQNMELFSSTSPFANHQTTTVPVWAQNSSLQMRLHMTFTSENCCGVNLLTFIAFGV